MGKPKGYYNWFYFIYLRKTDELLCTGSSDECARALGMSRTVFRTTVHRVFSGKNRKYEIYREKWKAEDE